jgi:DNA-directed RNA polymerase specialized sigma24 family protein
MFLISLCCGCARNAIRAERTLSGHGPKVVKKVSDGQLRDDGLMILSDRPEDEDMFGDITWTQVQAAIDALPPRQRQVILEDLAKIPVWKTAERMKLTPARIYQLKQKALEALRTALENPGTE